MDISARSYLSAGVALTVATAIVVAPQTYSPPTHLPGVTVSDIRLAVNPADVDAAITDLQAALDVATASLATASGAPGRGLIGVVDNITNGFDVLFTTLMDASGDPALAESFAILRTFAVDAWAMLAHNLTRINAVITGTTAQVGELLTTALTGSLRNVAVAGLAVGSAPLAPASYAGLLTAGIATGQLLVGNGLNLVQAVGDAGFDIAGIVVDELTFQLNNAIDGGLGKLLTQLGDASGSPLGAAVASAVRGLAFAPALAVVNFGSHVITATIDTVKAGFDAVLDAPSPRVDSTATAAAQQRPVGTATHKRPVKASKKPSSKKATGSTGARRSASTGHSARR